MSRQLDFFRSNYGFDREEVVIIPLEEENGARMVELFKSGVTGVGGIDAVSSTSFSFARGGATGIQEVEWQGTKIRTFDFKVDYDFIETIEMQLVAGRNFSRDFSTDPSGALIVNEALVRAFGWEEPVGSKFLFSRRRKSGYRSGGGFPL